MEVFRIAKEAHSNKLSASGNPNRWNFDEQFIIYTGSSRALSSLELIVHGNSLKPVFTYKVMVISIADGGHLFTHISEKELPKNWRSITAYPFLQLIGSSWYDSKQSLILKVPSAVIPQEFNYLINTTHPDFIDNIVLVRTENYFWDERLL